MLESMFFIVISFTLSGRLCPCNWFSKKVPKKIVMQMQTDPDLDLYCIENNIEDYKKKINEYKQASKKYIRKLGLPTCSDIEKKIQKSYEPKTILYSLETVDAAKKRLLKNYPITFSKKPVNYRSQLIKTYKILKMIMFFFEVQEKRPKKESYSNSRVLFDKKQKEIENALRYKKYMSNQTLASLVKSFKACVDQYFKKLKEKEKLYNQQEKSKIFLQDVKNTRAKNSAFAKASVYAKATTDKSADGKFILSKVEGADATL